MHWFAAAAGFALANARMHALYVYAGAPQAARPLLAPAYQHPAAFLNKCLRMFKHAHASPLWCRFFQVPRKLLERLAAEQRAVLGGEGEGEEGGLEGLQAFEEDDSELVFDDVGPEVSTLVVGNQCCDVVFDNVGPEVRRQRCQRWVHYGFKCRAVRELVFDDAGPQARSCRLCWVKQVPVLSTAVQGWRWRRRRAQHLCCRTTPMINIPFMLLAPLLLSFCQAYKDGEGEGDEPSTSGRDPEEEAKWAAFDSMVESWLGGSRPRVEVRRMLLCDI